MVTSSIQRCMQLPSVSKYGPISLIPYARIRETALYLYTFFHDNLSNLLETVPIINTTLKNGDAVDREYLDFQKREFNKVAGDCKNCNL